MMSGLKQRLIKLFPLATFMIFYLNSSAQQQEQWISGDTIRKIKIKVTAREKVENFDSLFHSFTPPKETEKRSFNKKKKSIHYPYQTSAGKIPAAGNTKQLSDSAASSSDTAGIADLIELERASRIEKLNRIGLNKVFEYHEPQLPTNQSNTEENINYMWIGFVLIIGGIVLGLIFGWAAFLVSGIGIILLLISYYFF